MYVEAPLAYKNAVAVVDVQVYDPETVDDVPIAAVQ